jgi:hypothetical protein
VQILNSIVFQSTSMLTGFVALSNQQFFDEDKLVEDLKIEEKERVPANTTNALGSKADQCQVEAVVPNVSKSFSFAPSEVMEEPKETKRNQVSAEPVDHEKYALRRPHILKVGRTKGQQGAAV